MEELKADMLMLKFSDRVPSGDAGMLKASLRSAEDSAFGRVAQCQTYNPFFVFFLSCFFSSLGVDRFYIGDVGLGVCKLLFGWVTLGIWPLLDLIFAYKKAKRKNLQKILDFITIGGGITNNK